MRPWASRSKVIPDPVELMMPASVKVSVLLFVSLTAVSCPVKPSMSYATPSLVVSR